MSPEQRQVTAQIGAEYPRWRVWHHGPSGRYYARRRGAFRAVSGPDAPRYAVMSASPAGLRVLLAVEDAKPPPDGWDI
jgi:hypothetical protein